MIVAAAIAPPIRIPAVGTIERAVNENAPTAIASAVAVSAGTPIARTAARRARGSGLRRPPQVIPAAASMTATNATASGGTEKTSATSAPTAASWTAARTAARPIAADSLSPAQRATPAAASAKPAPAATWVASCVVISVVRSTSAKRADQGAVVGGDEDRRPSAASARRVVADVVGGLAVQRGGRLVEQQDLRAARQRAGDRDAGALAARQLLGGAVGERLGVQARGAQGGVAVGVAELL